MVGGTRFVGEQAQVWGAKEKVGPSGVVSALEGWPGAVGPGRGTS